MYGYVFLFAPSKCPQVPRKSSSCFCIACSGNSLYWLILQTPDRESSCDLWITVHQFSSSNPNLPFILSPNISLAVSLSPSCSSEWGYLRLPSDRHIQVERMIGAVQFVVQSLVFKFWPSSSKKKQLLEEKNLRFGNGLTIVCFRICVISGPHTVFPIFSKNTTI